tara:strand:- start:3154 stop:3333 length:180 start_codon:yes stop_codon:yes gene_type:complete
MYLDVPYPLRSGGADGSAPVNVPSPPMYTRKTTRVQGTLQQQAALNAILPPTNSGLPFQ